VSDRWWNLRGWSHRRLLASWIAYWIVLVGVVAAPAIAQWWSLQRRGTRGTVSLIIEADTLETILWITGPPLLLGLAWLLSGPRASAIPAARAPAELPPPPVDEAALGERSRARRDELGT
jgi:hypothetical protein